MRLLAPAGLAAAALVAPLALWYVLRSRRPRVEVASTYLWRRVDLAVSAAVPWQRFRPDRTFWLVLLALLAGALALARPAIPVTAALGDHTIVIIDASGSMLADEDGPTRLELARREARQLAGRMSGGQVMSVVEAGPRARTLLSGSADPAAVRRAVDAVSATHGSSDLGDAFTLAGALERPGQDTVTHLFTDGALPLGAAAHAPSDLVVTAVGTERPNLAVTRLQASPGGAGEAQAFLQVRNFSTLPAVGRVTLSAGDIEIVEQQVRFAPRGTEELILPVDLSSAAGDSAMVVLRASVEAVGDVPGDALATDDSAWAVVAAEPELSVLVAGPGNVFVEAALEALEGVEVHVAPAVPDDLSGIDLLVVDRIPSPPDASVPTLYLDPRSPPEGVEAGGELENPVLVYQAPGHALLADVDLSEVAIAGARLVHAPTLTTVAGSPDGPLVLAGRLGATPVVYLPFDLHDSNLPLQVAWPVLVANAVTWLTGPPVPAPLTAGAEVVPPVPAGATALTAVPPAGPVIRLDVARPRLRVDQVGVWQVHVDDADEPAQLLAVNAPPEESDLARPRPQAAPARAPATAGAASEVDFQGVRELGRWLLAVVLALLVVEWAGAHGIRPLRRLGRRRRRGARKVARR